MNKGLTEDAILNAAHVCAGAGIKNLRLYYMIGLPWENESDINAIIVLTGKIRKEFNVHTGKIIVSVNPFIPKPQTPFQWSCMAEPSYILRAYKQLRNGICKISGVTLKTLSVRVALREAVISLGDDKVGSAIIENARDGVPWKKALSDNGVNVDKLIHRMKAPDGIFPWDVVAGEKTKATLFASFERAKSAAEKS